MAKTEYRPQVTARIPSDIAPERHSEIVGKIQTLNQKLNAFRCLTKADATERAAIMLSSSGVSACGCAGAAKV